MKKSIIAAGAASLALAAMPMAGVFAASGDSFNDTLMLTIAESCTISRGTTTNGHAVGTGADSVATSWGSGSGSPAPGTVDHIDTLSATVAAGSFYNNLGSSTFKVVCNDPDGYTVTAASNASGTLVAPGALTHTTNATEVTANYPWNYQAGGTDFADANSSLWTIATNATNNDIANSVVANTTAATRATGADGVTFNVTYKAAVKDGQPAGTYSTTVNYVLTQL